MPLLIRALNIIVAAFVFVQPVIASALNYGPYVGSEGYQEIKIDDTTYFVAFHGAAGVSTDDVSLAWKTRVAQLCEQIGATHFIELRYSFEPVFEGETPQSRLKLTHAPMWSHYRYAAGSVYIPIYIPQYRGPINMNSPSRLGHVRCVRDAAMTTSRDRLIDLEAVINQAKERKILLSK